MKNKEELAKQYAHNWFEMHETNNYKALEQGFLAGYAAKENKIRGQIQKLESQLEVNYTSLTLTEQIRKVAEIKIVVTKIEALKELL